MAVPKVGLIKAQVTMVSPPPPPNSRARSSVQLCGLHSDRVWSTRKPLYQLVNHTDNQISYQIVFQAPCFGRFALK